MTFTITISILEKRDIVLHTVSSAWVPWPKSQVAHDIEEQFQFLLLVYDSRPVTILPRNRTIRLTDTETGKTSWVRIVFFTCLSHPPLTDLYNLKRTFIFILSTTKLKQSFVLPTTYTMLFNTFVTTYFKVLIFCMYCPTSYERLFPQTQFCKQSRNLIKLINHLCSFCFRCSQLQVEFQISM